MQYSYGILTKFNTSKFILNSTSDTNYLLMKCQIHHKIQQAQVVKTKEDDNRQRLVLHHRQKKQRHQVPNEKRDEQFKT